MQTKVYAPWSDLHRAQSYQLHLPKFEHNFFIIYFSKFIWETQGINSNFILKVTCKILTILTGVVIVQAKIQNSERSYGQFCTFSAIFWS